MISARFKSALVKTLDRLIDPGFLSPGVVQGAGVLRETCVVRIASEGSLDTRSASFAPAAGLSRTSRSNSNHMP